MVNCQHQVITSLLWTDLRILKSLDYSELNHVTPVMFKSVLFLKMHAKFVRQLKGELYNYDYRSLSQPVNWCLNSAIYIYR